jgi:NTP pyrophosphatase (non-canonical NTP hydrolase)
MKKKDVAANDIYFIDENAEEIRESMKKEIGDVLWMAAGIAKEMGWTLEEVCQANLDKLADRQKRGKIVGSGDNR